MHHMVLKSFKFAYIMWYRTQKTTVLVQEHKKQLEINL